MRFGKFSFAALATLFICIALPAQETFHPKASAGAEVVAGKARFTVLTPRLIRMEWAEDGVFEDRATLGVVNRELPVPAFKVSKSAKKVVIRTDALTLTYTGQGEFDAKNLTVVFNMKDPSSKKGVKKVSWKPGDDDSGNLLGTARTLDGFNAEYKYKYGEGKGEGYTRDPFDKGVVSRDGWAVIDESERHVFVPVDCDWKYWVTTRPEGKRKDLYIFAYGHDYAQAVSDFTKVSGRIPIPPKYAMGYWWCRYWMYSDYELVDLAQHFKDLSIPADVMIIDMDWHETYEMKGYSKEYGVDEAGERKGWTGYSWKKELFPNPESALQTLHHYKLKTSLNLHPASGIQVFEEPYERFVKDYLQRAGEDYDGPRGYRKADGSPTYVPFRMDQIAWADSYFATVLHPMEEMGVDFWWLDWQQFIYSKYVPGLSNTFWLNHTFWNDIARRSASQGLDAPRPMIYHRWGGIGSHRYQVGFSGDTHATWKVLGYLPYFTATASNVGYAYWGHDIGGHMQPHGVRSTDPELYTRWLQEGVFTPIFKTHSTKDMSMEKRFWVFPDHFDAMREAIRLRYDLSPYIYTAARQAYDKGLGICRPLYYSWPEEEKAYSLTEEFMFGDNILATVVCKPADKVTGLAERAMWFPAGCDWWDTATGTLHKGGSEAVLHYTINENPWYAKAGSIIPLAGASISNLQDPSNELRIMLVPGEGKFETSLYEDDGVSQAYEVRYATTKLSRESTSKGLKFTVAAREGDWKDAPATRVLTIILPGFEAPAKVLVDGAEVPYSRFAAKDAAEGKLVWGYDGAELEARIYIPEAPVSKAQVIEVEGKYAFVAGEKGLVKRMRAITPEAKMVFAASVSALLQLTPELLAFAGTGSFITEDPFLAASYIEALDVKALEDSLRAFGKIPEEFITKLLAQIGMTSILH